MMIYSKETYIHDADLEIVVPNGILDFSEENIINDIINTQERTQIFYDELLHAYLITTLPPESNLETKEEATEFFKKLEVKLQVTLVDTPNLSNLAVPPNYSNTTDLVRTSSNSTVSSFVSGIFSSNTSISNSTNSTSPPTPGSLASDYSFKKITASKVIEGTVVHSAHYDSKNNNNKMVVVKRDDCWISVLPLSFSIANMKARAQNQIAIDVTVTQHRRKTTKSPEYSLENFGANLLEGLSDDPAFESLHFSIPTPQSTKQQDSVKKTNSVYSNLSSTPIKRCSRRILSLKSTLNARVRPTYVSPSENTIMMSVELENDTEKNIAFSIEDLKVEVAHGSVTRCAWGPQDTSNGEFPITLQPSDQVNFLYNVSVLEDPSFPEPLNAQQYYPAPIPHSKTSSRRESIASISPTLNESTIEGKQDKHRALTVIVGGCPIIDGVKSSRIESKWNCELDISTLFKDNSMTLFQSRGMVTDKYAQMMYNNKFNYGMERGFNTMNTATTIRDSFSLNSVRNYDSLHKRYGSDSSDAGIKINVNGTNIANKKQQMGYIPEINVNRGNNGILPNGRSPKLPKQMNLDLNPSDGVFVSFEVCGKPVVGKVFTVDVSVANRSKHARRFTIMVPNKKRPNEKFFHNHQLSTKTFLSDITLVESNNHECAKRTLGNPFMDEVAFLRKHFEYETPGADLICLDNSVKVGPLNPNDVETVTLHFISAKEDLHLVELVQVVDDDAGFTTNLRDVVQVKVSKNETRMKRMKRIDHNSFALSRHVEVTG